MSQKSPNRLTVSKDQLAEAGRVVGLGSVQTDVMWEDLQKRAPAPAAFSAAQIAWYFGAAVVLVAMGWLLAIVGSSYGTQALLVTSLAYTGLFTFAGYTLANQRDLRIPGGLLYVLATLMTPVTVTAASELFHFHLDSAASTALPALATAAVGLAFTRATRIAFVALPALLAGWFGVVSGAELLTPGHSVDWNLVSAAYGALVLLGSLVLDGKTDEDYSFWGYAVGAIALYTGLTFLNKGEGGYVLYALAGVGSMLFSVLLSRKVFAFAGAAAVLTWVGHLSMLVFLDSALFPLALTVIGGATIWGGVLYHRNAERIDAAILRLVPAFLRNSLPRR